MHDTFDLVTTTTRSDTLASPDQAKHHRPLRPKKCESPPNRRRDDSPIPPRWPGSSSTGRRSAESRAPFGSPRAGPLSHRRADTRTERSFERQSNHPTPAQRLPCLRLVPRAGRQRGSGPGRTPPSAISPSTGSSILHPSWLPRGTTAAVSPRSGLPDGRTSCTSSSTSPTDRSARSSSRRPCFLIAPNDDEHEGPE